MQDLHSIYVRFPKDFPLPFVLDGATGTALMREGMPRGECTEAWVLEHTGVIQQIQASYAKAGSDAVYAPTFGANRASLAKHGWTTAVPTLNQRLAAISRDAGTLIGGDLSPTGRFIEPYGNMKFSEAVDIYAEQALGLEAAGVDFYVLETMISLCETRAAVLGVKSASNKPIFVTMTVDGSGRTMSGDTMLCALLTLAELGVAAFGCNCSSGPADMIEVLKPLAPYAAALGIPLIAKPNAGMPHEAPDGTQYFEMDASRFAAFIPEFLNNGIVVLGGCCGTDSSHIAAIRNTVDQWEPVSAIQPADLSMLACTNQTTAKLSPEKTAAVEMIEVTEDFPDALDEIAEDADFLLFHVPDLRSAEIFLENAYMLHQPVGIRGAPEAAAHIKYQYNGKIIEI